VTLRLRARTALAVTDAGREDRTAQWPTTAFGTKFTVDTNGTFADAVAVPRLMRENIGQSILVPLWSEAVRLATPPSGATLTLALPVPSVLYAPGRQCALVSEVSGQSSVFRLQSVSAQSVTATANVPAGFVAGDILVPVIVTEPLSAEQTLAWLDAFTVKGEVEFAELLSSVIGLRSSVVSLPVFRSLPVWPLPFDWEQYDTQYLQTVAETRDADGLVAVTVLGEYARLQLDTGVGQLDRAELALVFAWFAAVQGRRGRFWLPSDRWDLVLPTESVAGLTLNVAAIGAVALVARGFAILIRDGARASWYARRVTAAVVEEDGTETLTLEAEVPALGIDVIISGLILARCPAKLESSAAHATAPPARSTDNRV
jgi:hypothetical protein